MYLPMLNIHIKICMYPGVVAHIYNLSTLGAEAGGGSCVQGHHPRLHRETLSQERQIKPNQKPCLQMSIATLPGFTKARNNSSVS
jgi:hypothetical protein